MEDLTAEVKQLKSEVKSLRKERFVSKGTEAESNKLLQSRVDYILQGEDIPVKDLMVLKGELHRKPVKVPKGDGCTTTMVSRQFVKRNKGFFDTVKTNVQVKHSQDGSTEEASEHILNGTLKLGSHEYTSN